MSWVRSSSLAALLFAATSSVLTAGFNPETGSYVFQQYSARDYGASPQNWSIAQDRRGIMYFGNTDGLLEFDGSTWRLIHPAGGKRVPAVAIDGKGTVYVGAMGDFGYLKPDATGTMQFVSLRDKVPVRDREFAEVWRILPSPQGVYFSSYSRLFRLNPDGSIKTWRPDKKFGRAFYVLNSLYVQTAGKGLLRVAGDSLEPVPGGERFRDEAVNDAVALGDGALMASNTSLYRLTHSGVEAFAAAANPALAQGLVYSMKLLPGGEIAVGTRKSGLILLNAAGGIDRAITSKSDNLAGDFVTAIYPDTQGGVWLAGQNGITRFNQGLSLYAKTSGVEGDVECMTRQGGSVYAGTTSGVFRMAVDAEGRPRFEKVEGLSDATWTLVPWEQNLLAATDRGVFLIAGNKAKNIFSITRTMYDVSPSLRDPNVVYAAGRAGVFLLRRSGVTWEKAAELPMPGAEVRTVLEDADGKVWATTTKEIWRIDFNREPIQAQRFGASEGIAPGWINARRLKGHVVFATAKGLRHFPEGSNRVEPDLTLGNEFANGTRDVVNVFDDPAGNVWVTGDRYHGLLQPQANGYTFKPMPLLAAGIQGIYWMSFDPDGTAWVTGDKYVLHRWDRGLAGDPDRAFSVLTRRVQIFNDEKDKNALYGGAGTIGALRLPYRDNALRFEFASPFFESPASVEYQVLLEGSDRRWSEWSHETMADYTHLPEGSYRFQVRARSPHEAVAEQGTLTFHVLPPWYRTWLAYGVYLVLGALVVWGAVRLRTRQLEADKRRLEIIVEERTEEIREQRDEIKEQERKSHALLLNILPAAVADELKSTGVVQPVGFDDVTVCFTDFVGFTLSSEKMQPGRLVDALNRYFTRFDEIIARYGLEKLKTIGDSYMFVSGLPKRRPSHAVDAVMAAMEMVEVVKELAATEDGTGWNIRVGLHSGPVVAGVVGIRKFAFDIWGNTVNFAARMESSGVPGFVNMSERTCRLTRGLIECDARGHVRIKEGRELPMFLARRLADDFAVRYQAEFAEMPAALPAAPNTQGTAVSAAFTAS